jgi:hypothetical protein
MEQQLQSHNYVGGNMNQQKFEVCVERDNSDGRMVISYRSGGDHTFRIKPADEIARLRSEMQELAREESSLRRGLVRAVTLPAGSVDNIDILLQILKTVSLELDTVLLGLDLLKRIEDAFSAVGVAPILDQLARLPDNLGIEFAAKGE